MGKFYLKEEETKTDSKKPYEPPKAIFIPLKIEERLMACRKTAGICNKNHLSSS
jgi:hypothetical protein